MVRRRPSSVIRPSPEVMDRVIDLYGRYRLLTFDRDGALLIMSRFGRLYRSADRGAIGRGRHPDPGDTVEAIGEDRHVPAGQKSFGDRFGPYGVHLYRLKNSWCKECKKNGKTRCSRIRRMYGM